MNGGITDPEEFPKERLDALLRVAELHQNAISDLARVATEHKTRHYRDIVNVAIRDDLRRIFSELKAIRERLDSTNGGRA